MYTKSKEKLPLSSEEIKQLYDCIKYMSAQDKPSFQTFPKNDFKRPLDSVPHFKELGAIIPTPEAKSGFKQLPHEGDLANLYAHFKDKQNSFKPPQGIIPNSKAKASGKEISRLYENIENENMQNVNNLNHADFEKIKENSKFFGVQRDYNYAACKNNYDEMLKSSRFGNSLKTGHFEDPGHNMGNDLASQTQGFSQFFIDEGGKPLPKMDSMEPLRKQNQSLRKPLRNDTNYFLASSSKLLFSYLLPFDVKVKHNVHGNKQMVIEMFENVEGMLGGFTIRISDPEELEFLFIGRISKEDFYLMKKQQNLRLDFSDFASKVGEMIRLCLDPSDKKSKQVQHRAVLEISQSNPQHSKGTFRIVQENEFRESDHISIQVVEAGDRVLVKYLSERLAKEISVRRQRESEIGGLREIVIGLQGDLKAVEERFVEQSAKRKRESETYNGKVRQALEDGRRVEEDLKEEMERVVGEKDRIKGQLEETLKKTQGELNDTQLKLEKVEGQLDQLNKTSSLKILELTRERDDLMSKGKKLGEELDDKTRQGTRLELEVATLKATNSKNEELIRESQELKEEARKNAETHRKMGENREDTIRELRAQNEKLKGKLIECTQEIGQLGKILSKMEEKKEEWQRKKREIQNSLKEERELGKKVKEILIEKEKQLETAKEEKIKIKNELEQSRQSISALKDKLEEREKQSKLNGETIQFLNYRLKDTEKPFLSSTLRTRGLETRDFSKGFGYTSMSKYSRYRSRDSLYRTSNENLDVKEETGYLASKPIKHANFGEIGSKQRNIEAILAKHAGIPGRKVYELGNENSDFTKKYDYKTKETGNFLHFINH